jgi:hypothetical protein
LPTHRLLEGTDIAKLLAQVRDEHGEDAKIVRAERVRTGGLAGFFSREHFELAVEIDDEGASPAPIPTVSSPGESAESQGRREEPSSELFGAVMNKEFRRSMATEITRIPDDVTDISAPVDALVSQTPADEDTFVSTARKENIERVASGMRSVRSFTPESVDAPAAAPKPTPAAGSMITSDVAEQLLAAAASAVAAAEATSRSVDTDRQVGSTMTITAERTAVKTIEAPARETTSKGPTAAPVSSTTASTPPEDDEPAAAAALGRHSKGAQPHTVAAQASSDRESLQRPFLGLARTSAIDSVAALNSGVLDSASAMVDQAAPLRTWLNMDGDSDRDQLPWPPRRPGEVLVLVGDAVAALHSARDIARHTRIGSASVFVVAPDLLPELAEERRIANPAHARQRRQELAQAASASIIVIDAPLTMAGDPLAAEWVRDMVHALDATAVWAVVDATRRPKDVRRWLAAIGGADGIVAHDVAATSEPGELMQLGAPVAYLDGVHATGAAWHSVHAHAQALERNTPDTMTTRRIPQMERMSS